MNLIQVILVLGALVAAAGGIVMFFRTANSHDKSPRRAYAPLGIILIGLMIAYKAYSDFASMETVDLVIMFLFIFALMALLGTQFFIVDRHSGDHDDRAR